MAKEEKDVKLSSDASAEGNPVSEDEKTQKQTEIEKEESISDTAAQKPPKGYVPYDALHAEREKRKALEEEIKKIKSSVSSDEELTRAYPDWELLDEQEKKRLKEQDTLKKDVLQLKERLAWEDDFRALIGQKEFASLKEEEAEFKDFAYDYPKTVDLKVLAKAFLYEKGGEPGELGQPTRPRMGLEKPTGGRDVPIGELTADDLKRIRETQPKLYEKMLREGRFDKVKLVKEEE